MGFGNHSNLKETEKVTYTIECLQYDRPFKGMHRIHDSAVF